jgi:hypothetical protein
MSFHYFISWVMPLSLSEKLSVSAAGRLIVLWHQQQLSGYSLMLQQCLT